MANPILAVIQSLFKPAADLIDNLHTSKEEKMVLSAQLMQIEASVLTQQISYQLELDKARANVIMAETKSDSWLTANWRPIIMLMFGFIIFNNHVLTAYFGAPQLDVPPDLWGLIKIGLGGYVVGRSFEKVQTIKNGSNK